MTTADLSALIPASSENRWSDLLASLIRTDPQPMIELLGSSFDTVRRELPGVAGQKDRLDLMLTRNGERVAVIEAKLFSDLAQNQLNRYKVGFPDAERYLVLHLAQLPPSFQRGAEWESLTWESVIEAHTRSRNDWVRLTAEAWQQQFDGLVPDVGPDTVWNEVRADPAEFELDLRARVAWLSNRMDTWCELDHDTVSASNGGNWIVRMWTEAAIPDHLVTLELQENLSSRSWKVDPGRPYRDRVKGPVGLLGLRHLSYNSETFDWGHLHRLFAAHILQPEGSFPTSRSWQSSRAQPHHEVDKQKWQDIVAAGAPASLGKGWGMRDAQKWGECVFGARYELAPTSTLSQVESDLKEMAAVVAAMARTGGAG